MSGRIHLVIFGCGYVGTQVARQALARGFRVTALTRNPGVATGLGQEGITTVVADLADGNWHERIAGPADLLLNTVSSGGGALAQYERSYVAGMKSIVRWARTQAARTFVYTGSTSVYPQGAGQLVTETAETAPADERAGLLLVAEKVLLRGGEVDESPPAPARSRGYARAIVLRLAGIYGPGRHQLLEQVKAGSVSGSGEHRLNLVHRDDICGAIWAAFDAPAGVGDGIFNVVDDQPTRKSEVTAWLAHRLGLPRPGFTDAPSATGRRVTPDRIISNARLKRTLAWSPLFPSFREGYENILSRAPD